MTEGRRVPIAIVIAVAAILMLALRDPTPARFVPARDEGRAPAAALAPSGVRSTAWYCAFATADRTPHSDDAAILTNLGGNAVPVSVSAMRGGSVTASRQVQLAAHATISLQAGDIGAAPGAG